MKAGGGYRDSPYTVGEPMDGAGSVDPTGMLFEVGNGTKTRLYGGIAFRYWLGTPGGSDLVAGSIGWPSPMSSSELDEAEHEARSAFSDQVRQTVLERTGLDVAPDPRRIEMLAVRIAESDLIERLQAYCSGWSSALPQGIRARDLKSGDVQRLGRMLGRAVHGGPGTRYQPQDPRIRRANAKEGN